MKCPECGNPPLPFLAFNVQNLKYVTCRHCRTRLVVRKLGWRFQASLLLSLLALVVGGLYTRELVEQLGNTVTLATYGVAAFCLFTLASYYAWKDGVVERR